MSPVNKDVVTIDRKNSSLCRIMSTYITKDENPSDTKKPHYKSKVLMFGTSGRTRTGTPEETRF